MRNQGLIKVSAAAALLGLASAGFSHAAEEPPRFAPNRTVRLISATTAGGGGDTLARAIAEKLAAKWRQPVVVENRTGANGLVAIQALVQSPPDGHTIFMAQSNLVQNLLLRKNPGYRLQDVAPVTTVTVSPMAIATSASTGLTQLKDVIGLAKKDGSRVSFGTFGTGSSAHVIGVGLTKLENAQMTHVPYKGEAASFPDLMAGQLTINFGTVGFYAQHAAAGKVRILAVTSPKRLTRYPEFPTLGELGYPQVNLAGWFGMFVPAATPAAQVNQVSADIRSVLAEPEIQKRIYDLGLEPASSTPDEFAAKLQDEMKNWARVIEQTGIQID